MVRLFWKKKVLVKFIFCVIFSRFCFSRFWISAQNFSSFCFQIFWKHSIKSQKKSSFARNTILNCSIFCVVNFLPKFRRFSAFSFPRFYILQTTFCVTLSSQKFTNTRTNISEKRDENSDKISAQNFSIFCFSIFGFSDKLNVK